jgi:hypothetical protein
MGRTANGKLHALVLYVDDDMIQKIDQVVALHKKVETTLPISTGCTSRAGFMRQFLAEQFKNFDGGKYQQRVMAKFNNLVETAYPSS